MLTIVDYGLGNIKAICNIYKRLGVEVTIAKNAQDLVPAEKILLPGVGAFDDAMRRLNASGMRATLEDLVINRRKPVLGICVGMQIMARRSEEGELDGLEWIDGEVRKFDVATMQQSTHLPHMGWNDVMPSRISPLFKSLEANAVFYFLHSYYFCCSNSKDILALTEYGKAFPSAINSDHIFGVQFHPEKSHHWGIQLLKNFGTL